MIESPILHDFPYSGTRIQKLLYLIEQRALFPGYLKSAPVRYRLSGEVLELYTDHAETDNECFRLSVINAGMVLASLMQLIRLIGYEPLVQSFPSISEPNLIAFIRIGDKIDHRENSSSSQYKETLKGAISLTHGSFLSEIANREGIFVCKLDKRRPGPRRRAGSNSEAVFEVDLPGFIENLTNVDTPGKTERSIKQPVPGNSHTLQLPVYEREQVIKVNLSGSEPSGSADSEFKREKNSSAPERNPGTETWLIKTQMDNTISWLAAGLTLGNFCNYGCKHCREAAVPKNGKILIDLMSDDRARKSTGLQDGQFNWGQIMVQVQLCV